MLGSSAGTNTVTVSVQGISQTVTFTATATTTNTAPTFTTDSTTRTIAENTEAGVNIGTPVVATDADNDTLTYTLGGTDATLFVIDRTIGQLKTLTALDYETKSTYTVTVTVSDSSLSDTITVTITVTDVAENTAPTFTDDISTTRAIAENTASGQNIGAPVAATDVDNDTLTYTLGGTDATSFDIDSTNGQLKTKAALDYETKSIYTVIITVSDGTLTDSITVTINITDVAETPTETGVCQVGNVLAPGESCTYPGTDTEFSVLSDGRGQFLFFTSGTSLNIKDTEINGVSYTLVTEKLASGSWKIEEIADSAETPGTTNTAPVFTDGASTTRVVAENTAAGVNIGSVVVATDADNDTLTYTLSGTDAASFGISNSTGQLQTQAALDYETKRTYVVTITVSDGTLTDIISVIIIVTDVVENTAPIFTDGASTTRVVAENTATGVNIGIPVAATDAQNDTLTYTLSGTDAASFSISSTTGQLKTKSVLDYETKRTYTVTVTVSDGTLTDTINVTINITDVVENTAPVFTDGASTTRSVAENTVTGVNIGNAIAATDADNDALIYTISGTDAASFSIVRTSGQLRTRAALDYETKRSYTITVSVSDGSLTDTITVTISVTDIDEVPEEIGDSESLTAQFEAMPVSHDGVNAFTFELRFSEEIEMSYVNMRDDVLDVTGGTVTGARRLAKRFENGQPSNLRWEITIAPESNADVSITLPPSVDCAVVGAVCTAAGLALSNRLETTVLGSGTQEPDPPEQPPVPTNTAPTFTDGASTARSIAENTAAGVNIGTPVAATDADNDALTYTISGTDAASFSIVRTSGQLRTRAALDYETKRSYTVTITVSDGSLTDTITVTINIINVVETPVVPTLNLLSGRTPQVRDAIVAAVPGVNSANDVTEAHLKTITRLDLSDKSITSLKAGDFDGLSSLRTLYLNDNQLTSLPSNLFSGLTTLRDLYLNNNQLTSLPVDLFAGLSSLRQINLHTNQLTSLPVGIFSGLSSLTQLFLRNNRLTSLPADVFSGLASLRYLYLDGNRLTSLPADLFSGLPSLTQLLLNDNRMSNLSAGMFRGLTASTWLWLQGNTVDPLPLTVSLEKVGTNQFKATVLAGAPFTIVLPLRVVNGTISGEVNALTIPQGSVESGRLTVTRTSGTTAAVTVDIGVLPGLPANHQGYQLAKPASPPLEIISGPGNSAPVFSDGTSTTRSIAENTATGIHIGTPVAATDTDNDTLTYTLRGTDAASFIIDATTGQLKTKAPLDYETKRSYTVTITVSDGSLADTITVTINVTDIDETPTDTGICKVGDILAPGESCTYPDTDATFSVLDNGHARWNIPGLPSWLAWANQVAIGGSLSFTATINDDDYHFVAEEVSGDSWEIKEIGDDRPEQPETPEQPQQPDTTDARVAFESTTPAGYTRVTLKKTGKVWGTPVKYTFDPTYSGDSDVGTVAYMVLAKLMGCNFADAEVDRESKVYIKTQALGQQNNFASETVCGKTSSTWSSSWPAARITHLRFFDEGSTPNIQEAVYNDATGQIEIPGTSVQTPTTTPTPTNTAPTFTAGSTTTRSVAENTAAGRNIGSPVSATDAQNDTLTYTLGGTDANAFSIERTTGQLKTKSALDYETKSTYTVTVTVFDGSLSDTITVTISITDVAETPTPQQPGRGGETPTLSASTASPLTEATLHESIVTLTLTGRAYEDSSYTVARAVTVSGIDGVTFKTWDVDHISDTEVTVELTFNGDFDTNATLTFTVEADAIADYDGPAFTAQIPVTGGTESIVASTDAPLTEATLDESVVTLTLSGRVYKDWLPSDAVTVSGIDGITFSSFFDVDRQSDTEVTVELTFNGDFDTNATLTLTVGAGAIAGYGGTPFTAQIPVTGGTESIVASTDAPLTEATLDESVVTLTLSGRVYKDWLPSDAVTVSGIDGITFSSFFDVDRQSDTEVTVELTFNGDFDTNATLTLTVGAGAIAGYGGTPFTAQIPVTGGTESIVASTDAPLTEATLDESVVTLTLSGRVYKDWLPSDAVTVSGIDGITFSSFFDVDRQSDTVMTVELTFNGDFDTNATLTFTVDPGAIAAYDGTALTAQITVTATQGVLKAPSGISLMHVPLQVTAVDGVTQTIESVGDLYEVLGGADAVNLLITHNPRTQSWHSYLGEASRGTSRRYCFNR